MKTHMYYLAGGGIYITAHYVNFHKDIRIADVNEKTPGYRVYYVF